MAENRGCCWKLVSYRVVLWQARDSRFFWSFSDEDFSAQLYKKNDFLFLFLHEFFVLLSAKITFLAEFILLYWLSWPLLDNASAWPFPISGETWENQSVLIKYKGKNWIKLSLSVPCCLFNISILIKTHSLFYHFKVSLKHHACGDILIRGKERLKKVGFSVFKTTANGIIYVQFVIKKKRIAG